MKDKYYLLIPLLGIFALITNTLSLAHAVDVQSSVQIIAFCGLDVRSGSPLDYPGVKPGEISPSPTQQPRAIFLSNPGDAIADVLVRGTDWQGSGATVMNVGATHYSITQSEAYDQMDTLTSNDVSVMQLDPGNPPPIEGTFWRLKADLTDPTFRGSASQTLTVTGQC